MEKKYWKGIEELNNDPEFTRLKNDEFYEHLPVEEAIGNKVSSPTQATRRDFLKFLGFGVTAATLAACETPVRKTMPYVVKPEDVLPGVPNYYASTYSDGHDYASILVKTREGRPIKIEGNDLSSINKGSVNARVQASVLGLYNNNRLQKPTKDGAPAEWSIINPEIKSKLKAATNIRIVSSSLTSPSTKKAISDFTTAFPSTKHIVYDSVSHYGIIKANELSFGRAVLPTYHFENADVIVSIACDFLANWISPVEHARAYAANRKVNKNKSSMSKHIQIESALSLTGSNADDRIRIRPSESGKAIVSLYNKIASKGGSATTGGTSVADKELDAVANELWNAKGKALVVCGSNDVNQQVVVNAINALLGSYDSTIDLDRYSNMKQSNDAAMDELVKEMKTGSVGAVIFLNSNPAYNYYDANAFNDGLKKTALSISFASTNNETASQCKYVCTGSHYLESWSDAEPVKGSYSLGQPAIQKLYDTKQPEECLLAWADVAVADYHTYIQEYWKNNIHNAASGMSFEAFWTKCLQDGVYETAAPSKTTVSFAGNVNDASSKLSAEKSSGEFDIILYEKTGIGDGKHANNPWLQELPDPVSKICWDNYAAVSPKTAKAKGWEQGSVIEVKAGSISIKLPVCIQPGISENTIAVAVGYGRTGAGKAGNNVGKNVYPLVKFSDGCLIYQTSGTASKTTDDNYQLATTQTHHTMMGRDIMRESNLSSYKKDPKAGNPDVLIAGPDGVTKFKPKDLDLWATEKNPEHAPINHHWGLGIDLNSCIGCGACVVACQAENNIAVVGKDEIGRAREMHWIRIDRYYSSDTTKENAEAKGLGKVAMYGEMEIPTAENPKVSFMPVMCQHCNHAPCETVCPVVATTHSTDGLNMMAYNRCVGTRYCANNCPYKVRRFNWFNYSLKDKYPFTFSDPMERMVLNPDVVVRSRGVMEKCSMCIQRLQYGKLEAKQAGRRPKDGEIKTACAQTCPTNAITFGDYMDKDSQLNVQFKEERTYWLLEELNIQPSVFYQTKIWNREEA